MELIPNDQGRLEIDLYGDLAAILTLAGNKDRPLEASDPTLCLLLFATRRPGGDEVQLEGL